tara:strand:- start:3126 stop:4076 length:951 start_codon:yes stop_codon:yes gene_type:complete
MMEQAKFYSEIADGPTSCKAYWMQTEDNLRVRLSIYRPEADPKGTILLMLGRFGYAERYGRVAKTFADRGYATAVIDWRSQGLSDRIAKDPLAGHINRFSDYQKDVAAMLTALGELDLPKPYYLIGVSMGALIALRSLVDGLEVAAASFISPMWGIKMSPIERVAAWPLSWASQKVGLGHKYVPGESSDIYVLNTPFEDNNLTHNPAMYEYWMEQARKAPELQIGGPTMSWLYEALAECRDLSRISSPNVPCITFCGEMDQLVDNAAILGRMEKWSNGKFQMVRDAKHDVLTETPEVGGDVMGQILSFFEENAHMN